MKPITEQDIDEALWELAQKGILKGFYMNGDIWYIPTEEGVKVAQLIQQNEIKGK